MDLQLQIKRIVVYYQINYGFLSEHWHRHILLESCTELYSCSNCFFYLDIGRKTQFLNHLNDLSMSKLKLGLINYVHDNAFVVESTNASSQASIQMLRHHEFEFRLVCDKNELSFNCQNKSIIYTNLLSFMDITLLFHDY